MAINVLGAGWGLWKELILTGDVKYVGDGKDPAQDPYMKAYARALKEVYQPERTTPEDDKVMWSSVLDEYPYQPFICDVPNSENK